MLTTYWTQLRTLDPVEKGQDWLEHPFVHPNDRLGQWIDNGDEESMIIIICQSTTSPLVCWWYNFSSIII